MAELGARAGPWSRRCWSAPAGTCPTAGEKASLDRSIRAAVQHQQVLRLRLSDLSGTLVYASDGAGTRPPTDDEALDAARGQAVAQLPRLDTDSGQAGPGVPEAHEPLGTEVGMLTGIRIAGVRILIDNFGAGQTSLGCLASLPTHELKIKRAIRITAVVQTVGDGAMGGQVALLRGFPARRVVKAGASVRGGGSGP